jgi:hypothetical protein
MSLAVIGPGFGRTGTVWRYRWLLAHGRSLQVEGSSLRMGAPTRRQVMPKRAVDYVDSYVGSQTHGLKKIARRSQPCNVDWFQSSRSRLEHWRG